MSPKRGYFGIGVYNSKTPMNIGTLWRSAYVFGASFIFTIGARYKYQSSDTVKAYQHIPLFNYESFDDFSLNRPYDCPLVGIEQSERSVDIVSFSHPVRAMYLLGAEDNGLPEKVQDRCQHIIHINTGMCLNVAVAGSIVMFDRQGKC